MQTLAWHHLKCLIPEDWEVTTYALPASEGRLELSTRQGVQAQVSWDTCKTTPDVRRMMTELHRRHLRKSRPQRFLEFQELSTIQAGDFLAGFWETGGLCHAGRFLEEERILVRWEFPDYRPEMLDGLWAPLLKSCEPNAAEWRDYAVFGLHVAFPAEFKPTEVSPFPANATMAFENPAGLNVVLHRWGLPDLVLAGQTLENFYVNALSRSGCRARKTRQVSLSGVDAFEVEYDRRAERGVEKLYGRWPGRGVIWRNDEEMRLYALEQTGPRKLPRLDPRRVFRLL